MIFFVANDGTVIASEPSPVYQGAAGTNNIYLVAPFAEGLQAAVAFKLPNGVYTTRYAMSEPQFLSGIVDKLTGQTYKCWQYSMPNGITQYYGTVTAQFFFYPEEGGVITPTSSVSFVVGKGVPSIKPAAPSDDVFDDIMSNLSQLSKQLNNGEFAARAIYQWNSTYTYGAGEITYYPLDTYGVFIKSLIDNNRTEPYVGGVLNSKSWQEVVDFDILNGLYGLKNELEEGIAAAQESATTAQAAADRLEGSLEYFESVIPSTANSDNKLTTEAFVNSSINNMAAFYITYNAAGDAFPTRADLLKATIFYSGGKERVPTQNDYAIVLADESQPVSVDGSYPTTRYSFRAAPIPTDSGIFSI